jgi:hypothetical protein
MNMVAINSVIYNLFLAVHRFLPLPFEPGLTKMQQHYLLIVMLTDGAVETVSFI